MSDHARLLQSPADDSRPSPSACRGPVGTARSVSVAGLRLRFPPEVIEQFAGTCAHAFRTAMWKNCSPNGAPYQRDMTLPTAPARPLSGSRIRSSGACVEWPPSTRGLGCGCHGVAVLVDHVTICR